MEYFPLFYMQVNFRRCFDAVFESARGKDSDERVLSIRFEFVLEVTDLLTEALWKITNIFSDYEEYISSK